MKITTQHDEFGDIAPLEDQRPGTLDVTWAEAALRQVRGSSDPLISSLVPYEVTFKNPSTGPIAIDAARPGPADGSLPIR